MAKFEKILAIYCVVAITVLVIGSVSFLPRPQNYLMLALFIPVGIYFWLRLTAPNEVSTSKWSLRLLLVLFALILAGIFGFWLATKQTNNNPIVPSQTDDKQTLADPNTSLTGELTKIKKDLAEIKTALKIQNLTSSTDQTDIAGVLGDETKVAVGTLAQRTGISGVHVYRDPTTNAPTVGTLTSGENYSFYKKENGWYQIALTNNLEGWVNSQSVTETTTP